MAAEAPDPKTFRSWEDAFQYPIAVVRGMERQLRSDIDSDREKLRSLIGTSYRDLLGSAESILEMDSQMQDVESYLGQMGMRCNSTLLEKKAANLRAWNHDTKTRDNERYALASQMAVLRGCPEAIARLLKNGASLLLAANILVLSRLLHKKLSQREDPPPYLEVLRQRLANLRQKLRTMIDRRFRSLEASESVLIEAMCALSLTTSSSATDVLRHFLHVRGSTVSDFGQMRDDDRGIFKSLRMVVKTLKDCQVMIPTQLSRALESLKLIKLLRKPDIRSLLELNLDIHQRWLGEDINNFIPYIRHDDLQKLEANRLLKQWARQTFSSFIESLREKVDNINDPAFIVSLRQELLELWFSNQSISMDVDMSEVEEIRDAFSHRLKDLIHQRCADLSSVASTIDLRLEGWENGVSDACPAMWEDAITTIDTASSVSALKEALSIRAYGRSPPVQFVSTAYATWLETIHELEAVIQGMRQKKWADGFDEVDDDCVFENKQALLSEDDPRLLQETLDDALKQNFQMLDHLMQTHAQNLDNNRIDDVEAGHKSCFLLRASQDITTKLPASYPRPENTANYIAILHARIAKSALQQPLSRCQRRFRKSLRQKQLRTRILWDGDPQLPVLPSPYAFRLLHETIKSMTAFGADIWTPRATGILKHQLRDAVASIMNVAPEDTRQVNGHGPKSNGSKDNEGMNSHKDNSGSASPKEEDPEDKEDEEREDREGAQTAKPNGECPSKPEGLSEDVIREMRIQRLFDVLYLQNAASIKGSDGEDALDRTRNGIGLSVALTDRDLNRMKKSADGYWKRTEWLFALLA
ncbi:MAG: hypothetical protein Q9211_005844 [Gyalolechia sp. 1 TL-2023]